LVQVLTARAIGTVSNLITTDDSDVELNSGSVWHRWEPHVHSPGTLLNNQFKGLDAWERYLDSLEAADPPIRAIAVTDYYLTETYERVLQEKILGRLPNVDLIFPNIEMRLDVGTMRGRWVNIHLLVSPEDPEHTIQLGRLLARLRFGAYDDTFVCTRDDLIRLGKRADPLITENGAALRHGAMQFKVNFAQLREEFTKMAWARENILIAVAGSRTDGTSGVREAADATLRQEMEKFAHVIFASSPVQRDFWLGLRDLDENQLRARYDGLKPCLHGSDAHDQETVAIPAEERFSWVKGEVEFDSLRQACIDPAGRAYVGPNPPETGTASQLISRLEILGAPWARTPRIALNPGLVAIIGARGSGKTALTDIIAIACDAISPDQFDDEDRRPSSSFLKRAHDLLGGTAVKLVWRAGAPTTRALDGSTNDDLAYPRARYLSQQFVEELCSAGGVTDALLREIERVIFESHSLVDREGALDFSELLERRAARFRQSRAREEEALVVLSERISTELEKDRQIADLTAQVHQKKQLIAGYSAYRAKLVGKGSEERVARLTELTAAAEKVRGYLRFFNNQEQALLALQDEVTDLRQNQAPEMLRRSQERHAASRMKPEEWSPFLIDYTGDVDAQLEALLKKSRAASRSWKGARPDPSQTPETPLIGSDVELHELPLALLEAEIERLQKLVSADVQTANQFATVSKRIVAESTALELLNEKLEDAKGAKGRARALLQEREAAYIRVFEAIISEQNVLTELYRPLMTRLAASPGTLQKLSFTVSRTADVQMWAQIAEEELVDLRRQGPFRGKGNLQPLAEDVLKVAWETGDPQAASTAMTKFRELYQDDLLEHSKVPKANQTDFRAWSKRFAHWLFSTDHIQIHYGIEYDGVDIRKLSPGTRGIVLLLLYLTLDDADDRPLIIDQPEENLDPKSVFDELVDLFIAAKSKRQVIMVTHNANLVINTDADQIIVAEAGPHQRGELPEISYTSGGLENASIRKAVCDILEGGEHAFKERARRLRVRLDR
jgi:energy-coupling factor transporter ATP-binding protein EcfA2